MLIRLIRYLTLRIENRAYWLLKSISSSTVYGFVPRSTTSIYSQKDLECKCLAYITLGSKKEQTSLYNFYIRAILVPTLDVDYIRRSSENEKKPQDMYHEYTIRNNKY